MKYRIAIDLCSFEPVHKGGKDQVAYNLLLGFDKICVSDQIVCFCHDNLVPVIREYNKNVHIEIVPNKRIIRRLYEVYLSKKMGIELLVFSNKPTIKMKLHLKTVVIPHDIEVFENGKISGINYKMTVALKHKMRIKLDFLLRDYIIAISDFDKNEMIKFMPWSKGKIHRIYDPIKFDEYMVSCDEKKEYITAINIQWIHKNVETLIRAYSMIVHKTNLNLILVGKEPENIDRLKEVVNECQINDRVIFTGFVNGNKMKEIANKTRIYVNTSVFEGFGMTNIEMMGMGVPTIVANSTAMPEVTMGLCRYYEPADSSEALAVAIIDELENPIGYEKLINISNSVKSVYSYENIARQYWEFFLSCMD